MDWWTDGRKIRPWRPGPDVNLHLKANEGEVSKRAHLTGVVSFGAGCAEEKYPGKNFV